MTEIDWKQYEGLSVEMAAPAVDRFEETLRKAVVVATEQSIPVFTGTLRGSLVTVMRQMLEILKRFSELQLDSRQVDKIHWKTVEDEMREAFFSRLADIKDLYIAQDYLNYRVKGMPADMDRLYEWVYSLHGKEREIRRFSRQIMEKTKLFAREDVPRIMETELLGIRRAR